MKKYLFITAILSLTVFSCILDGGGEGRTNFWAKDFKSASQASYRVEAELLVSGDYCNVWVEKGCGVGYDTAKRVADEFDNKIFGGIVNSFGIDFDYSMISHLLVEDADIPADFEISAMKLADLYGDQDDKLCILLLDIKDSYNMLNNLSYVGGYFWAGDLMEGYGSNMRDMIYIDTNPGMISEELMQDAFATLAHEMQHLMNFITSLVTRYNTTNKKTYLMDTWIDEGLSSAAEYVYTGKHVQERIDWFMGYKRDASGEIVQTKVEGLIDKGNNFFVWGNRSNENQYANLDDYATVYLFFQWLRLQNGGHIGVYKNIIKSNYYDYNAVVGVMNNYNTWDELLKTWLAANYINDSNSMNGYGYSNDPVLKDVKTPGSTSIPTSISLAPGEGVYSIANSQPNISNQGSNIKNVYLTSSTVSSTFSAGSALLTYNANIELEGSAETGITTGTPIPLATSSIEISQGRSAFTSVTKPYRIDAGDLIGRKQVDIKGLKLNESR